MLHVDFETRSRVDLKAAGAHVYAADPSTKVLMMGYAFGDGPVQLWRAWEGADFPLDVRRYLHEGGDVCAHNAQFERLIFWNVLGFTKELPVERFYCTAAQARSQGLPGKLDDVAIALRVQLRKDHRGGQLIRLLSIPREDGTFCDDPELMEEFAEYCVQDVRVERAIHACMQPMADVHRLDYVVNEIICDRGLCIDRAFAERVAELAEAEQSSLKDEVRRLTAVTVIVPAHEKVVTNRKGEKVVKVPAKKLRNLHVLQGPRLTQYVYLSLSEAQRRHMHKYADGVKKLTLDRNALDRLLADQSITGTTRELIQVIDDSRASSTGKYKAMVARTGQFGELGEPRARGAFILNGAAATGRFSSSGIQVHNFPRKVLDPETFEKFRALVLS